MIPINTSKESMNRLSLLLDVSPLHQASIGILCLLALLYDLKILVVFRSSILDFFHPLQGQPLKKYGIGISGQQSFS